MPAITVRLGNKVGLHARPAAALVRVAKAFQSEIRLTCNGKEANAKSILSVLSLGAEGDAEVGIEASGGDAEAALAALEALIAKRFGEPE